MNKLKFFLLLLLPLVFSVFCFYMIFFIGGGKWIIIDFLLRQPVSVSYTHYLPNSATDVNEKYIELQNYPAGELEYRYFLKAKLTQEEFKELADDLKLDWATSKNRPHVPTKVKELSWWNPPTSTFLYVKGGDGADYFTQADYQPLTGYMYLYVEKN